jgi:high-affinity K+ transport system ATPase subunit B
MPDEKQELTPEKEFDNHIGEAFGAVVLSAIAWIAMFIFADGYEMLGESPVMVVIAILFHVALTYILYRAGESKNPTLAVIALSILVLEFGLTVFFGFAEAMETHRGASAGTGLALFGLWKTIKAIRFLVRSSKPSVETE